MEVDRKDDRKLPPWEFCTWKEKILCLFIKLIIYLPVFTVIALALSYYSVYMLFYIHPLMTDISEIPEIYFYHTEAEKKWSKKKGIVLGLCMSSFLFTFLISFARASLTIPGHVPQTPQWEVPQEPVQNFYIKNLKLAPRSCKSCRVKKPDRCHHCRQCESCILKMDHHCNWIGNCVGVKNFKYFFLIVLYGLLSCGLFVGSFWETLMVILLDQGYQMGLAIFLLACYFFSCLLTIALLAFFVFHCWLISKNMTSLEYFERRGAKTAVSLHSSSLAKNLKEALGENPVFWLMPFGWYRNEEDGLYLPGIITN